MNDRSAFHEARALCPAPAARVLRHLSSREGMAQWCLGLMDHLREVEPGLLHGRSRFDGGEGWCRVVVDEGALAVEYHLGASPEQLQPRIAARVEPAASPHEAGSPPSCTVVLAARRAPGMDDARWQRLIAAHECEVLLIQQQVQRA